MTTTKTVYQSYENATNLQHQSNQISATTFMNTFCLGGCFTKQEEGSIVIHLMIDVYLITVEISVTTRKKIRNYLL
jgi:hypothetical protein